MGMLVTPAWASSDRGKVFFPHMPKVFRDTVSFVVAGQCG